jgi:hypothetical protein
MGYVYDEPNVAVGIAAVIPHHKYNIFGVLRIADLKVKLLLGFLVPLSVQADGLHFFFRRITPDQHS